MLEVNLGQHLVSDSFSSLTKRANTGIFTVWALAIRCSSGYARQINTPRGISRKRNPIIYIELYMSYKDRLLVEV